MKSITLDDNNCFKIVVNKCYGGFGLSLLAIERMAEIGSPEAKIDLNNKKNNYINGSFYSYYFDNNRYDYFLIKVVEELGEKANGQFSKLEIETICLDRLFRIENYDGKEEIIF